MGAASKPALEQFPTALGAEGQVGVLEDAEVGEEGREPKPLVEHGAAPDGARGGNEIHLSSTIMRWLQFPIDCVAGLEIESPRFVRCEQAQSPVPTPPGRGVRIEVL